jgi:hypothetical protein
VGEAKKVAETPQHAGKELGGQRQQPRQPMVDEAPSETWKEKKQPELQTEREELQ